MSGSRTQTIVVENFSNQEFLERYARPGRIGLVGGITLIDKAIRRAQRLVDDSGRWSAWSHALVFGERRSDGYQWVLESDLAAARKHIRFGVQENRVSKYFDEATFGSLAVLDFGLPTEKEQLVIQHGLDLLAGSARYSIRELFGALLAMRHPALRERENVLAREQSYFCSAFVRHVYEQAGIELAPGVALKNTTPEDIARTAVPHTAYVLDRPLPVGKLTALAGGCGGKWERLKAKGPDRNDPP